MIINGISGANNNIQAGASGMGNMTDAVSKNIQSQIARAQKELQELASNQDMAMEEKMKKKQELQQEISMLNQQLRQHQIEMRREQQAKDTSMDEMLGSDRNVAREKDNESGLSQASMQAMISADSSMKHAKAQGSVASKLDGKAGVLESEIHMDKTRGGNVEKKEQELSEIQAKAKAAASSQISTLDKAVKKMKEPAEEERETEAAEDEKNAADKKPENIRVDIRL